MDYQGLKKFLKFVPDALAAQGRSKDPSTQVGAIAIDDDYNVRASGYNGFPRGVSDIVALYEDKDSKYPRIVHAESNLVAQAARTGVSIRDCTVIVTELYPCPTCTGILIQAGIKRVLFPDHKMPERWATPWVISKEMFNQSGIELYSYNKDDLKREK